MCWQKIQRFLFLFLMVFALFSVSLAESILCVEQNYHVFALSSQPDKVVLGGNAIGFNYCGDGVIVLANNRKTDSFVDTSKQELLKEGDIIHKIDDKEVFSCEDISNYLNDKPAKEEVTVVFSRDGKEFTSTLKPTFDLLSNSFKLGIWAKDEVSGLGTLTYINPKSGYFASLGHPLTEGTTGKVLPVKEGKVYDCNILGINKSANGIPGELKGTISRNKNIGDISKNTNFGIYGHIKDKEMLSSSNLVFVGGRKTAKPGYAQIYTSIDNSGVKPYDIQIIKTNYQSTSNTKSMVLKVTDKSLLEKTGGIVQGMSGSPIVQDGKLVGALTHVFTNDSTKGFGVYIDWMM